MVKLRYT